MNPRDVFGGKEDGLESKLPNYEQEDKITPLTIQGIEYQLLTYEYNNLMQILTETGTEIKELKKYKEGYPLNKYFGIGIENYSITKLQINKYELTKMPLEIGKLTQLEYLDLGKNKISTIPAELKDLQNRGVIKII